MECPALTLLHGKATEWFPLLPRPRPPCRALRLRIDEINQLARTARHGETQRRLAAAAEALNKAALIASDCGLADLARQLCWRQFDIFHAAAPLDVTAAKYALQPVVNLARLHIRGGQPSGAYQILHSAYESMTSQIPAMIDGRYLDLARLVDQDEHRQELRRFLWTVLLADGSRALIRSGQWGQALRHLDHHRGIGHRMLDGRQVTILARTAGGDFAAALDLLDHSDTPEAWERAVAACLRTLCLRAGGQPARFAVTEMVNQYLQLDPIPGHLVFRTRLGLCLLDLIDGPGEARLSEVAARIVTEAVASADGYIARDVLTHPSHHLALSEADKNTLAKTTEASGLHRADMPTDLLDDLMTATTASEAELARSLGHL